MQFFVVPVNEARTVPDFAARRLIRQITVSSGADLGLASKQALEEVKASSVPVFAMFSKDDDESIYFIKGLEDGEHGNCD